MKLILNNQVETVLFAITQSCMLFNEFIIKHPNHSTLPVDATRVLYDVWDKKLDGMVIILRDFGVGDEALERFLNEQYHPIKQFLRQQQAN